MKRGVLFFLGLLLVIGLVGANPVLETSSVLLKVSLNQGDLTHRSVAISSDVGGQFIVEVSGVPGVSLSTPRVTLLQNEKYDLNVAFNSSDVETGVYVGYLTIMNSGEKSTVPIILEIESRDVFFDVNLDIPPQYTELTPGDKFVATVKVFDLISGGTTDGLGPSTVDVEYILIGFDGRVLSSETESVIVDQQARITKSLSLPRDLDRGDYVFVASAKYKSSVGVSSQLFSVNAGTSVFGSSLDLGGSGFLILIIVLIVLGFFAVFVFLFVFLIRDRDKMFLELRRYNSSELRKQKELLEEQERRLVDRGADKREVDVEVKNKIVQIKQKQQARVKEIRILKKHGKVASMRERMEDWKKQGYNVMPLEYKLKGLSTEDMRDVLKKWKKKYKS